jgi:hypothetical protein
MNLQELANQVRETPPCDLLRWHGFEIKSEGVTFRAKNDRHNIVVTGNRWFDNKSGIGGAGAIDLQMHLSGSNFPAACRALANEFRPVVVRYIGLSFPPEHHDRAEQARKPFHELAARYAVRDETNWTIARAYLLETRGIDPAIVDDLHAVGSIYANDHRRIRALFFSTAPTTGESRVRPCATHGTNPFSARASETSSRPGSRWAVLPTRTPLSPSSPHRRTKLLHDLCGARRRSCGDELCRSRRPE